MKAALPTKLKAYRADLAPTIKGLTDLTKILKGILPGLVMLEVTTFYRYFLYLTTNAVSTMQWEMTKLVVGVPNTDGDIAIIDVDDVSLNSPGGSKTKLHEFELRVYDQTWVEPATLCTIENAIERGLTFYIPTTEYVNYSVNKNLTFIVPCSTITVALS